LQLACRLHQSSTIFLQTHIHFTRTPPSPHGHLLDRLTQSIYTKAMSQNYDLFGDLPPVSKPVQPAATAPAAAPAAAPIAAPEIVQPSTQPPATKGDIAGKKLYLIDASGFIFRAYHALPKLTRADGTPIGAVVGFMNMMIKLLDTHASDYFAVVFDAGRYTFRNRMYEAYKANRDETPEELIPQFGLVREATKALNLHAIELPDFEADDVIATYATQACNAGMEVVIVSSDKDLMQLVNDCICMYDAMKSRDIRTPEVLEKFGVPPEKVGDVLALMGDSSDNIPGVPGIGPKTAAELINQFGDLETLLSRTDEIKQNKRRETLQEHAENARLSRKLVALHCEAPVPLPLESLAYNAPDPATLISFVRDQGFRALYTRLSEKYKNGGVAVELPSEPQASKPASHELATAPAETATVANSNFDRSKYQLVTSVDQLHALMQRAEAQGILAVDTETSALDALQAELVGVSFALADNDAYYIPLAHRDELNLLREEQMPREAALALLKPVLDSPAILKIGQNIKYDILVFAQAGIALAPVADTMVQSYTLNAGTHPHNMDFLAERYLNHITLSFTDVMGSGRNKRKSFAEVPLADALAYAAEDADVTWRLYHHFLPQLVAAKLMRVDELDTQMVSVLAAMEQRGITVDRARLAALTTVLRAKADGLEKEIHALAGREFLVSSPKQLGEILFDELNLPGGKKNSKTGQYSTDAQLLEELAEAGHALPAKVIEYRQATKLINTYTEALPEQINPNTGRVHTSFNITGAATGRLSSSDPNLQNIPIRTEEGRQIREAFVAKEGCVLLSADYSQIELRLLADMAGIDVLRDAFKHGRDIHAATASQMFGVPLEEVNSELRRKAKTINFGIIYGISAHGLAVRLQISRQEAAAYIAQYFEQYPGIKNYMEAKKEEAREFGYITTLFGRRVHIAGINDKNGMKRAFAERQAINAPLQGTAADIIKRAMLQLQPLLTEHAKDAALLLQVHDELVFEVKADQADALMPKIKKVMEQAAHLSIPLTVEVGKGEHWGNAH
jgi:DNA polymerase-1